MNAISTTVMLVKPQKLPWMFMKGLVLIVLNNVECVVVIGA